MTILDKIFEAANNLGITMSLIKTGPNPGPVFELPKVKLTKEQYTELRKLRLVMVRNRDAIIRRLGGNPDDYKWVPAEGTEEHKWYTHLQSCIIDEHPGLYVGDSGREWHSRRDAERLIAQCVNTDEWKKQARAFWWDTTHAISFKDDSYSWPLLSE